MQWAWFQATVGKRVRRGERTGSMQQKEPYHRAFVREYELFVLSFPLGNICRMGDYRCGAMAVGRKRRGFH